jgi:hypothetical protein
MSTGEKSSSSSGKQSGEEGEGTKILIKNFIVRDGKVSLAMSMIGNKDIEANASVPKIHLTNIGGKEGGLSPTRAFKQVLTALYGTIASPSVIGALSAEIKAQGIDIEGLEGGAKEELKKATNKLKGLFGK